MEGLITRLAERVELLAIDGYDPGMVALLVTPEEEAWLVRQPNHPFIYLEKVGQFNVRFMGWQVAVRNQQ